MRARTEAKVMSRVRAWVETRGGGWLSMAAAGAAAVLATELLKRGAFPMQGAHPIPAGSALRHLPGPPSVTQMLFQRR